VAHGADFYLDRYRATKAADTRVSHGPSIENLIERVSALDRVAAFGMAPFNVGAAEWAERTYGILASR
jgi:hypothetical protein